MTDLAVINPAKGKNAPNLSDFVVLVSSEGDLNALCEMLGMQQHKRVSLSRIYQGKSVSLAGPVAGAPYAVMILETLIAWGARQILFFGWCGSISHDIHTGDIVIPDKAFIDEGTSRHYGADELVPVYPSDNLLEKTKQALSRNNSGFHQGAIWSTDAIYRETHDKIRHYQDKQVLAVEMEVSALFSVAKFRNIDLSAILVVSDELATLQWKPGFKDERFVQARKFVYETIRNLAR